MISVVATFTTRPAPFVIFLDFGLSEYSSLNFNITIFKTQFIYVFVIIKQFISLMIWIKSIRPSLYYSLTSTLYQLVTTMDSDDTSDDSDWNLMHQISEEIRIGENAKVTQHVPEF